MLQSYPLNPIPYKIAKPSVSLVATGAQASGSDIIQPTPHQFILVTISINAYNVMIIILGKWR